MAEAAIAAITDRPSVLILAYGWPPDASVGAVRPVYLSRQLTMLGLRPIVITVREEYHEHRNEGGIAGSDSARVIRTRFLESPRHLYLSARAFAMRVLGGRRPANGSGATQSGERAGQAMSFGARLKRNIVSLLYTPDEFLGWFPFALAASLKVASAHRPICVISTGPPHTSHLVALFLKRLRHIPWIADLRDPWAWPDKATDEPARWSDRINARLERLMIEHADRVVCVTPAVTRAYAERYPAAPASLWETITNGFDLDEFRSLGKVPRGERFTISYVGGFDFERSPLLLLEAVAALIAEGSIDPGKIAIRFVGPCEQANGRSTVAMIQELGLAAVAEVVPPVPRPQALREVMAADVLLLLAGTQRRSVAAKVYEYLASGRPILAIADDGAAAEMITSLGAGRVVAPTDLSAAKAAVACWYGKRFAEPSTPSSQAAELEDKVLAYSWGRLGIRYAELIRALPQRD